MYDLPEEFKFTIKGEELFYNASEMEGFKEKDSQIIFDTLVKKINPIPFCEHLKRYVYTKAKFKGKYEEISDEEYLNYIVMMIGITLFILMV